MRSISAIALAEKNKLGTTSVFLPCLKLVIPNVSDPIRLVSNNENITWQDEIWVAFPFEIGRVTENSKGEVPRVDIKVSNVNRVMDSYIAQYDLYCKSNGYSPIDVTIYVVNSANLASNTPEMELDFILVQPKCGPVWATFTIGSANPLRKRCPMSRCLKNQCRFKFRGDRCGWNFGYGAATCDKTLTTCQGMGGSSSLPPNLSAPSKNGSSGNSSRYGGFPGIGLGGITLAS